MPSDFNQLKLFLKVFIELCARRRTGLDPSVEKALRSIIFELEDEKTPALENLLDFESAFARLETRDPHLRYLHCVLKGFRERKYRSSAASPLSPVSRQA